MKRVTTAIGMLLLAGLFLFTVKINTLLFGVLPKTDGWVVVGTYIPYALIIVAIGLLVSQLKRTK